VADGREKIAARLKEIKKPNSQNSSKITLEKRRGSKSSSKIRKKRRRQIERGEGHPVHARKNG